MAMILGSAAAHVQTVLDGDDSSSPVDVVAGRLSHGRRELRLRVVTYEEWASSTLGGQKRFAAFEVDLDRDGRPDRCIAASWTNDVMDDPSQGYFRPTVYEGCTYAAEDEIGTGTWSRPDEHTLVLTVDRSLFAPVSEGAFRWRAVTSYEEDGQGPCGATGETEPSLYGTCADFTAWTLHRR
jgi:hypothetical protein